MHDLPILPLHCLHIVVSYVEDTRDLYTLLTVSRGLFHMAAACLWYDPFSQLPRGSHKASHILTQMILALSPLQDEETNALAKACSSQLGSNSSLSERQPPPTVDYIRLIKALSVPDPDLSLPSKMDTLFPKDGSGLYSNPRDALTWAVFGHRFDTVQSLTIEGNSLRRYINEAAPKMQRIQRVYIHFNDAKRHQDYYRDATLLVQEIQDHHGQDRLRECRATTNPLLAAREQLRSRVREEENNDANNNDDELQPPRDFALAEVDAALKLYRLLPPFNTLHPQDQDPVRPVGQLLNADMERLTQLTIMPMMDIQNSSSSQSQNNDALSEYAQSFTPNPWRLLHKLLPERSPGQILEQCRSLKSLKARIDTESGEALFQWAEKRRRQRRRRDPSVVVEAVAPIAHLTLEKTSDVELQPVEDAIRAFSSTLEHLQLTCLPPPNPTQRPPPPLRSWGYYYPQEVPFLNLVVVSFPRLEHLSMDSYEAIDVDAYLLERCPVLKTVSLRLGKPWSAVDDIQQSATFWPHLNLPPSIETLDLGGRSTVLFDPALFAKMPKLENLTIEWPSSSSSSASSVANHPRMVSGPSPTLLALLTQRWVWTWSFSYLTTLKVGGITADYHFSFKVLRFCPRLRSLLLSTEALIREGEIPDRFEGDEANVGGGNAGEQDANSRLGGGDFDWDDNNNGNDNDDVDDNEEYKENDDECDIYNNSGNNNNSSRPSEVYPLRVRSVLEERDRFYQVQELELQGHWGMEDRKEITHLLYEVFPSLSKLRVKYMNTLSIEEWVSLTQRHPTLQSVQVDEGTSRSLALRLTMAETMLRWTPRASVLRGASSQGKRILIV
ncbi:hypothetical protein DFQ26_004548 [Actinomortierella ambigua]|nr:hypothetical protein DFQ26_004548 [Actinomortierella ambigua]